MASKFTYLITCLAALLLFALASLAYGHGKPTTVQDCHIDPKNKQGHCHETYSRAAYGYKSYKFAEGTPDFYTGEKNCDLEVDHIVSLYDAHFSGGSDWDERKKRLFANDRVNHVPACSHLNRLKGAAKPAELLTKSKDGVDPDFDFASGKFCKYVETYFWVKLNYGLSLKENSEDIFGFCGLQINFD